MVREKEHQDLCLMPSETSRQKQVSQSWLCWIAGFAINCVHIWVACGILPARNWAQQLCICSQSKVFQRKLVDYVIFSCRTTRTRGYWRSKCFKEKNTGRFIQTPYRLTSQGNLWNCKYFSWTITIFPIHFLFTFHFF